MDWKCLNFDFVTVLSTKYINKHIVGNIQKSEYKKNQKLIGSPFRYQIAGINIRLNKTAIA